jgi:hypothetical protein
MIITLKEVMNQSMQDRTTHFVQNQKAHNEDCNAEEWKVWNRGGTRVMKDL